MTITSLPIYLRTNLKPAAAGPGLAKGWYWLAATVLSLMMWWMAFHASGVIDLVS